METPQPAVKKKGSIGDWVGFLFGIVILLVSCSAFAGTVFLDIAGEKTVGKLNTVMGDCSGSKTCFTQYMEFTAKSGEQVSFLVMTFPMFIDFDPFLRGKPYEEYGNYEVRYFESFPRLAKVKLMYFLEYINSVCGLCLGVFLTLIGSFVVRVNKSDKPSKPLMVIDLSKRRK
ncbi:MAG: hypothetical protein HYZ24_06360 [Chloroflexi bacterium]|nr:hypothetical protein [Chloroflexota bacterium]